MLSNISSSLERFVWVLESSGRYILQLANDAFLSLEKVVYEDFHMLSLSMEGLKRRYDHYQGRNMSLAIELYEKTQMDVKRMLLIQGTHLIDIASLYVSIYLDSNLISHYLC